MRTENHLTDTNIFRKSAVKSQTNAENISEEIYRMMLFLNKIDDKATGKNFLPIVSDDTKPGKKEKPLREIYPNITCAN